MAGKSSGNLKKLISDYLTCAKERIGSAEQLFKSHKFRDSISRPYYAFLDAADAILLTKNIRIKSHTETISQFSKYLIKSGLIEKKYIRWFRKIEPARKDADYERVKKFNNEDAKEALLGAKEFVSTIEKLIPFIIEDNKGISR